MTWEVGAVLAILLVAVVLFITERLRVDLVAVLVLLSLTIIGLISNEQALAGFSNPAVITVASVLVLSGGLMRTGVANILGRQVLRLAGDSEARLLIVMMVAVGGLSGIMNNIAVTALMLPAVLDISRRIGRPPSKLLMPLAFGGLLGGLLTLIGTAPNILLSGALADHGLAPFRLFDFTPVGLVAVVVGIAYMVLVGRHLLPERDVGRESMGPKAPRAEQKDFKVYDLKKRLFAITLPQRSALSGKTLAESRLGSALGLNVLTITRDGKTTMAPGSDSVLQAGDKILVEGRLDQLNTLRSWKHLVLSNRFPLEELIAASLDLAEVEVPDESELVGKTLLEGHFRRRFGLNVLAISHDGDIRMKELGEVPLASGDVLLVQGDAGSIAQLPDETELSFLKKISGEECGERYNLHRRLIGARVPEGSILDGKMLAESRLGGAFGLNVLGIIREGETQLMSDPAEEFRAGDTLLVQGEPADLFTIYGLQSLEVDEDEAPDVEELESETVGMAEVMLSPHTTLAGETVKELYFREKYGLTVLAIWRGGRAYRSNLRDMEVRLGDALLVYGDRTKMALLSRDPDFLVLTEEAQEAYRREKAPLAGAIEVGVLAAVMVGFLPIYIAAPAGAALMILTGCLTMDEAYTFIDWKAVVLIAGMLGMGVAMQETGTASMIATTVLQTLGSLGNTALLAGLFLVTAVSAQIMPTAVVAVLQAPIAIQVAADSGLSPHALMMVVAIGASAAFMSPVGHPANLLVMGLGGYRFTDYAKVGVGLTLLLLLVAVFVVPLFWPLIA